MDRLYTVTPVVVSKTFRRPIERPFPDRAEEVASKWLERVLRRWCRRLTLVMTPPHTELITDTGGHILHVSSEAAALYRTAPSFFGHREEVIAEVLTLAPGMSGIPVVDVPGDIVESVPMRNLLLDMSIPGVVVG